MVDNPDMESGSSHEGSFKTLSLVIPRRLILIIITMIPDPSCASVATSQGIKRLNVLKGSRGILPMLVQLRDDLQQWQPRKFTMQAWLK
jgi:hypothetical protein